MHIFHFSLFSNHPSISSPARQSSHLRPSRHHLHEVRGQGCAGVAACRLCVPPLPAAQRAARHLRGVQRHINTLRKARQFTRSSTRDFATPIRAAEIDCCVVLGIALHVQHCVRSHDDHLYCSEANFLGIVTGSTWIEMYSAAISTRLFKSSWLCTQIRQSQHLRSLVSQGLPLLQGKQEQHVQPLMFPSRSSIASAPRSTAFTHGVKASDSSPSTNYTSG